MRTYEIVRGLSIVSHICVETEVTSLLLFRTGSLASRGRLDGELEELWQVEQRAEDGDGERVGEHVPPLGAACLNEKERERIYVNVKLGCGVLKCVR